MAGAFFFFSIMLCFNGGGGGLDGGLLVVRLSFHELLQSVLKTLLWRGIIGSKI